MGGAAAVGVTTVRVVAVADSIVGDVTTVVDGTDEGVSVAVPEDDCSRLATGVRGDADETVAPGVAVGVFAVGVGVGGPRRLVTMAGGGVVGCTTGAVVVDSRGAMVGDVATCLVGVAVDVIVEDGAAVPVPAAPTVCDPRMPNQRRLPMIVTMPR